MLQIIRQCKYEHIEKFVLYGERHCGTKFLEQSLDCFNLESTHFFGHKHWFGFSNNEKIEFEMNTLFICVVRNAYSWIPAFFDLPHQVLHKNRLSLESFMLCEWQSINPDRTEILQDRNMHDKSKRYKNIFEMRASKINYMINILPNYAKNYMFIRYEDLTQNYSNIMGLIKKKFNLVQYKSFPTAVPVINRVLHDNHKKIIDENLNWQLENCIGYYKI
jgi:hypothetical protein